ncbi:MAG: F-ATPase gamma subunit [Planctomycetota bacterium]|jgi:F-type H+-transporting ATPase subunit gamma
MANRRLLVKRLKAVRNIRKITRTMELIATSRFKKAMDRATEAAEYTRKISEIVGDLGQASLKFSHPLLQRHTEEKNGILLVLTANRGLCGGYNASVLRQTLAHVRQQNEKGVQTSLEVSGKRGIKFLNFQKVAMDQTYTHFEDKTSFLEVEAIASRYADLYIAGKIDRLDVAYTRFESSSKQFAIVETILPLASLSSGGTANSSGVDYDFLPSAQEILEEIVPAAFRAKLFKCFLDSIVSEQIARMVAMKGATENADEMAGSLKQQYNRARQAGITSELAEIIGGAAALG